MPAGLNDYSVAPSVRRFFGPPAMPNDDLPLSGHVGFPSAPFGFIVVRRAVLSDAWPKICIRWRCGNGRGKSNSGSMRHIPVIAA